MLLVHVYVAVRVGPRLSGKALLFVFAIQIASVLGTVAELAPSDSLQRSIIYLAVVLCIEDSLRTWFVAKRVRKGVSIAVSSLAFAIAISFFEIVFQLFDLITVAINNAFGAAIEGDVEFYDLFFSSYSRPLATVGIEALRPFDHFFLCVSLYYAWRMRNWLLYSALVILHIALDLILETIMNRDPLNAPVPMLAAALPFTMMLCLVTLWIRATAKRHSTLTDTS